MKRTSGYSTCFLSFNGAVRSPWGKLRSFSFIRPIWQQEGGQSARRLIGRCRLVALPVGPLFAPSVGPLVSQSGRRCIDWAVGQSVCQSVSWSVCQSAHRLVGPLVSRPAAWPLVLPSVGPSVGRQLVAPSVGPSVGRQLVGLSVGRLVGWSVRLSSCVSVRSSVGHAGCWSVGLSVHQLNTTKIFYICRNNTSVSNILLKFNSST